MRRAYQKAVTIPLNNVEHLWKEYDQWENNLNRLTAKKFLGEKSSAYMTARTALREMRLFTDNINTNVVSLPPKWTANELAQLDLWKNYIQWEKSDPLQLEDDTAVMDRVAYTYQQAFLVLRLYPEIWYSFASYYLELNKPEKSLSILKQGIEIMPTSLLLNFSYAELCESRRQLDDARQAYDQLVTTLDKNIEDLKATAKQQIDKLHEEAEAERASLNLSDDIDGEVREQLRSREKHVKKEQDAIEKKLNDQVDVIARGGSLVWINYMRFARRTDGIKSARALFSRARKAANCTYHVYVSDALMEYHNSKDAVIAGKVFSLGQKSFADNPDFVCEYLDFLIEMNDDNNTRALFERTLATMPAEKAGPIWLKFLDYENKYGDLASIQSVEKRRIEAMATPSVNTMESFLKRQSYLDVRNIEDHELGWVARDQLLADAAAAAAAGGAPATATAATAATTTAAATASSPWQGSPLLEPVHPERYPRPDLNQWQSYKPAARPANASPIITTVVPMAAPEPAPVKIEPLPQQSAIAPPPPQPAPQQQPSWHSPNVMAPPPVPIIASNPAGNVLVNPAPSSIPSSALPDAVAYFVSNLPPAHTFNGPMIQPGELVDLLRNIIIPLPPQQQQPPSQQPQQPSQRPNKPPMHQQQSLQNRDSGRGGGHNYGRGGGRGGYNKRGGGNMSMRGGKPMKRRGGRDDYDDDYQPHKGMGPNRPPDFDVFRQRQAKRHRDDPPY
ncbi:hypothetical protein FB192DRAFT_1421002 [Mucor lusitanicus]|uniref:Suppressor of forked domain-containing protein n=1 Tax=Mucor circinelloides f. lusitanicus TaxID=29924 RepID=A0A8H4F1T7_MUCCL|nr:hypothetical protein FB192DRAFT_1421002 [Mucor lusitanicus]